MSNSIEEIEDSKCLLVFGYNAADSHPIVARRVIKAKEKGAKIIVCDPRFIETARIADLYLPLKNGSNIALLNAFANVIINENLYNKAFVADHTEGFDAYKETVAKYTPEYASEICGVSPDLIRAAARMYAEAPSANVMWGMGVTQWSQGVDTVKTLAGLALITGNLGRPNVGVSPVRGQNNVQGACDMGALPNQFPGYQLVTDEKARRKFAEAWGVPSLPDKVSHFLSEVPHQVVHEGKIKAFYVMGEDPMQTEPDLSLVRQSFEALELVIVQDIFMTKTVLMADVVFPATSWGEHEGVYTCADRGFQRFSKAIEPQGDVKTDWQIISLMSGALGYPMQYENTQQIWDEMRALCPLFAGVSYEKMAGLGNVQWPCPTEDHPGTQYLYEGNQFSTPSGKGKLFATEWKPPLERTDAEYPFVLATVREVGQYSCRSMTGNCAALQTLADEPGYMQIHPDDAAPLGVGDQELIWIASRRGKVITRANFNERVNRGAVYMTYQWWIGACNTLTMEEGDPNTKTPEYKHTAAKVERIVDQQWAEQYVAQTYRQMKEEMSQNMKTAETV